MAYVLLLLALLTLYIRPGDLQPQFSTWPILEIISILLALAIALSWAAKTSRIRWSHSLTWLVGTWFAFVFSQIAHTYFAMTLTSFVEFFRNVFIACAIVFVLDNRKRLQGFATVWIWAAVFLAVGGVVQSATGLGWGGQALFKGRIQGVGIFNDPNDLALTFLIAVPLARVRYSRNGPFGYFVFGLLALLFTYAIFLTQSRGGMLSLLLIFFLFSAHRFGFKWGTVVGMIIVAVLLRVGSSSRVNEIDSKEESAQGRIAAWSAGLQMFKQNPAVGVGYGMFTNSYPLTAHNSFVLSFAETGLIGAYFWVGLLYVSLLGLRRLAIASSAHPPDLWLLAWTKNTQIAFVAFLAAIFFLSRTYNVLLYLLIGFAGALWRIGIDERPAANFLVTRKDRALIFGIVVSGIVLIYVLVRLLAIWKSRIY